MKRRKFGGEVKIEAERLVTERGGDRAANSAPHIIAIGRLRTDARTRDYVARRIAERHTKLEAIRALKRHIAREVYHIIRRSHREINQTRIAA
jgi:transposase